MLAAAAPFIGPGLAVGSGLLSAFGKNKAPTPATSKSGYYAAPPGTQQGISATMAPVLNTAIHPQIQNLLSQYGITPDDPRYNSALARLQAMNPNQPLHAQNVQADMRPSQIAALYANENPDYSPQGLAQYMQPFQGSGEAAKAKLNQGFDTIGTKIADKRALTGSRDATHTNDRFQNLLRRNETDRLQAVTGLEEFLQDRNTMRALNLRDQSLQAQYGAGQQFQNFNQQELNNAGGYSQFANNPYVGQARGMLELMGPLMGGTQGIGGMEGQSGMLTRLGGVGQQLLNMNYGGGGYGQPNQQYGSGARWF
jgi:hypothetical protein